MSTSIEQLGPALDIDARLTEIERRMNLLVNVTPVNAAEAWADFERSDFGDGPHPAAAAAGVRPGPGAT